MTPFSHRFASLYTLNDATVYSTTVLHFFAIQWACSHTVGLWGLCYLGLHLISHVEKWSACLGS